jgi:hypothetical protein
MALERCPVCSGVTTGEVFYAVRSVVKRHLDYVRKPKAFVASEGLSV